MLKPLQDKIMCDNYECEKGHIFLVDEKAPLPSKCPFCLACEKYVIEGLICEDCDMYSIGAEEGYEEGYKVGFNRKDENNETTSHKV